jgi:hypothetical protein
MFMIATIASDGSTTSATFSSATLKLKSVDNALIVGAEKHEGLDFKTKNLNIKAFSNRLPDYLSIVIKRIYTC